MVLVHHRQKSKKILAVKETALPEGLVLSGEIHNQDEMRKILESMIESVSNHYLERDVVVSIPWANGVLADCITIKKKDNTPDEQVILFEAGSRPPFDDQNITLDYKVLSKNEKNEMNVLLVAAKNATLAGIADFFHSVNLKPFALDVDVFALVNSTSRVVALREEQPEVRAVLMIGEQRGHITFIKEGTYHSTREINSSSVAFILKSVSRVVNVSVEDIKSLLFDGVEIEGSQEIYQALGESIDDLTTSVNSAISYFHSSEPGFIVDEIILAGGGALIPGLDQKFADILNLTVSILDSFEGMKIDASLLEGEDSINPSDRVRMAVALGLAMRTP